MELPWLYNIEWDKTETLDGRDVQIFHLSRLLEPKVDKTGDNKF